MSKCELDIHVCIDLRLYGCSYVLTRDDGTKSRVPPNQVSLSSYRGHKTWIVRSETSDFQFAFDRIVKIEKRS